MAQIEGVADTPVIHLMGSPWSPDATTVCGEPAKNMWATYEIKNVTCEVCKPLIGD